MAKNSDKTEAPLTAHELLEARVDAMMDSKAQPEATPPAAASEAIDIFADTPPGAPAMNGDLNHIESDKSGQKGPSVEPPLAPEAAVAEDITVQPSELDTPQSDAAIDDIVAQEADEVLAAEDTGLAAARAETEAAEQPQNHGHPIFWFFIVLLAIIAVIAAVVLTNPNW